MNAQPLIVCIGGAAIDRTYRAAAPLVAGTSNPARAEPLAFGGVARNVAENLARLEVRAGFVSAVGDDEAGRALGAHLSALGIAAHLATVPGHGTAEYVAVLDPAGELAFGLAAMGILDAITPALIDDAWPLLATAAIVFADCNLPAPALRHLVARRREAAFRLVIDAVSTPKVRRLPESLSGIDCLFANADEAAALLDIRGTADEAELVAGTRARGAGAVVLTRGARGALVADAEGTAALPAPPAAVVDVTGAGDALIAGTLSRLVAGAALREAVRTGLLASALTIERTGSVRADLSPALLRGAQGRIEALEPR